MLDGDEEVAYADAGYQGIAMRPEMREKKPGNVSESGPLHRENKFPIVPFEGGI